MNIFEQVSRDGHQMALAVGALVRSPCTVRFNVWRGGLGRVGPGGKGKGPCTMSSNVSWVIVT